MKSSIFNNQAIKEAIDTAAEMSIYSALHTALDGIILPETHFKNTPARILKLWREITSGYKKSVDFTVFPSCSSNWIVMKNINFTSWCAHHILPFSGTVDIAYMPESVICGLSKLPRVVDMFSSRLQVQENLGDEIRDFLVSKLGTTKVIVVLNAKHSCVGCRGIRSEDAECTTYHFGGKDITLETVNMLVKIK